MYTYCKGEDAQPYLHWAEQTRALLAKRSPVFSACYQPSKMATRQ